jgi:uncharacterized phage protein gp47/JayE
MSLYRPLDKTPRHNLLKVLASVDAGIYHQLLGDLDFLAQQIFPDTAEGAYLREHWSDKAAPLYAVAASGEVTVTGTAGKAIPAGVVFQAVSGEHYYQDKSYSLDTAGRAVIMVQAEQPGLQGNLGPGEKLSIISAIPAGIDSTALVTGSGISGGADGESDEVYLARVLQALRNTARYGKPGDFADWAVDSSPEVSKAWEFKNFGVFGALLIQVVGGSQMDGVTPVGNVSRVAEYISAVAPPVLFTVRTPELLPLDPAIALLQAEDTLSNRDLAVNRLKTYLEATAAPGARYTAGMLREAIIDGVIISGAAVKLNGSMTGDTTTTILQLPVLGDVSWE